MNKVAIIMTSYKHELYIYEAIQSVIEQSYDSRELFIGDDSPDNETRKIVEKFINKYPNKIHGRHHKENKGITRNMEFLIKKAENFEYIAVLEGDDYRDKDYLKKKINIFENYNCVLVYNDIKKIDSNSNIFVNNYLKNVNGTHFYKCDSFELNEVLNIGSTLYLSRSTLMFKNDVLKNVPLEIPKLSPFNLISDYNFFLRVGSKYNIYGLDEDLTYYREHNQNTSKQKFYDLILDLYKLSLSYKDKNYISEETFKNISTRYLLILIVGYIRKLFSISKKLAIKNFLFLVSEKF